MLPEGIEIPDGTMPGDTIEVLASVKLKEGGKAEIVALDGITIPGYEEDEDDGEMEEEEVEEIPAQPAPRRGFVETAMGGMMG